MNPGVGNFQFPQLGKFGFPLTVRAILAHLGLAPGPDSPGPAPPQPDHTAATK